MPDPTATRLPDPRLVPPAVTGVLRTLRGARKQAWLAGGAVRDLLRIAQGEKLTPPQDFDVATDALPEEVQRLFPRTAPTGIAHGTVTVLADEQHKVEVTTFRGEGPYLDGRRPSSVPWGSRSTASARTACARCGPSVSPARCGLRWTAGPNAPSRRRWTSSPRWPGSACG